MEEQTEIKKASAALKRETAAEPPVRLRSVTELARASRKSDAPVVGQPKTIAEAYALAKWQLED